MGCTQTNSVLNDKKINKSEIILMHNKQRAINKCEICLVPEKTLNDNSQKWAEHMAKNNNLKHSELQIDGSEFWIMGENIASGQKDIDSVMNDWMKSKGHRENIVNRKFTNIGVGYANSTDGITYWCVQFGSK